MDADRIHTEHQTVTVPESPQVERAYQNIKMGIVRGRYPPGAPLSEVSLAREHGMSRTPVREGLARLWQERYLDRVVGHGYFVARVTVQSIHDTFDVRRLLEGAAAARAAERATADEIEAMRRLAIVPISAPEQNLEGADDYREAEAANARFHMAIASAARNTLAQELIERCLAQVDRFMSLGVQFGPFQEGATAAHLEIVDAIGRRDPIAAKARMEEHLDCGSQRMKDMLLRGQLSAVGVG